MYQNRSFLWLLVLLAGVTGALVGRRMLKPASTMKSDKPDIVFVVGGEGPFWKIVIAGAKEAAAQYGVNLTVHIPDGKESAQMTVLTQLDSQECDGLAISPMSPSTQTKILSRIASKTNLVTFDNDAPLSLRHCYIGTNNYEAGRLCARLVAEALPQGGKVALFVGDVQRLNARQRRVGLISQLLDRTYTDPDLMIPVDESISGNGFTIVKTYLDDSDPNRAKKNVTTALDEHPDLDAVVALYGYGGPACAEAIEEEGKTGSVIIVAFDEFEATLKGVANGRIIGTIVQDPFQYGYESVRMLHSLYRRLDNTVPLAGHGSIYLPCSTLRKDDIDDYRNKLSERLQSTVDSSDPREPRTE